MLNMNLYLTIILIFAFGACNQKSKEIEKVVKVNAWGKDFEIKPMSTANTQEKEWARAVAIVEYLGGGSGTGFFISEDGLFLTNEHVVGRHFCNETQCGGIRIIRGFSEQGDNQIYYKVRPLVQSKEYDFSLLKVELGAGEKVPYVELAIKSDNDDDLKNLLVIGHPAGSPAKPTPVDYENKGSQNIIYKGPTFWGNSGSPLLATDSGKVEGLVSFIRFDSSIIESDGDLTLRSGALKAFTIIQTVRKAYPDFYQYTPSKFSDLKPAINNTPDQTFKDILPRKSTDIADKIADDDKSVENFYAEVMGTVDETPYIQTLFANQSGFVSSKDRFIDLLENLNFISLNTGRPFVFNEATKSLINKVVFSGNLGDVEESKDLFNVMTGSMTKDKCLTSQSAIDSLSFALRACHSTVSYYEASLMEAVVKFYNQTKELANSKGGIYLEKLNAWGSYFISTVNIRSKLGPFSANEKQQAQLMLEQIARENPILSVQFRAQNMLVKLEHMSFEKPF